MGRKHLWRDLKREKYLHFMALPVIVWLAIFCYRPMFGIIIAFKDFKFNMGILGSPWVGLKHFQSFLTDPNITVILVNTLAISALKIVFMFPVPILFALMLNEITNIKFKKTTQTISYLPYFISWSIIAVMALNWLSPSTGFVNKFLVYTHILQKPILFLGNANYFWGVSVALDVWKNTGWSSIIFLAAIAGIDQEMYEAALIDGTSRIQRIMYITLPSIMGTVMIILILNIGSMLSGGLYSSNFSISYLLGNPLNLPKSEIIDTYVLKMGLQLGRYSFSAAVGLLSSVVSLILLISANFASKKLTSESFF